jgi:hypothetical protein
MHANGIIKRLAYVSGGAAVADEVTPKPGAKKTIAKEIHEAENAQDRTNRGVGATVVGISYSYR